MTQLLVDHRFGIIVWWKDGGRNTSATIVIEAPFTIREGVGAGTHSCDPANTSSLGPALSLFGRGIETVAAHRDGLLLIRFADGTELRVPKREDARETWESFGSGELDDIGMLCSQHDVAPWGGKL